MFINIISLSFYLGLVDLSEIRKTTKTDRKLVFEHDSELTVLAIFSSYTVVVQNVKNIIWDTEF